MQEAHPVADLAGERHLMGGEQHGHAGGLEAPHHVEHLADQFGVERRGDLVEQHHFGVHRERPCDRHPLLLPAGQLVGIGVGPVGQPESGEHHQRVLARGRLVGAEHLAWSDGDIVDHAHVGEQVETLEHHADATADRIGVEARFGDVDAVEEQLAVVGGLEQVDAAQQRRLARSGRADQRDHVADCHVEVDAVEHHGRPERLAHPAYRELRHRRLRRRDLGLVAHAIVVAPVRARWRASAQSARRVQGIVSARKISDAAT